MSGVVMLVNEFPPLPVGGAETQAERLSEYLSRKGWDLWVVTRHADGLPHLEERNGFEVVRPLTLGKGKLRTISFMFFSLVKLIRMRHQYQILHGHLAFGPALVGVVLGRFLGKRVVVKLGGSNAIGDIHTSQKTFRGRLRLAAIRKWADVVIVLTEVMKSEALSVGVPSEHIRFINNGIDANAYRFDQAVKEEAKKRLNLSDKTVALFVGRLDPVKSLPTLINAMAVAVKSCPSLHLVIVGDGPEKADLERLTESLDVNQYITFTGAQKDVRPYFHSADIFTICSYTEGISNALLEAMSAGLACVATPVGGNNEVLDHGKYGVMTPVEDVQAWASVLSDLSRDAMKRQQLGELARQRILDVYDFSVVGATYEALYKELLNKTTD